MTYSEELDDWLRKVVNVLVENNKATSWEELSKETKLVGYQLNCALRELFNRQAVKKDDYGKYNLVDNTRKSDQKNSPKILIFDEQNGNQIQQSSTQNFHQEIVNKQETLLNWLTTWKSIKKLDFSLENKHFFLDGVYIDELTKDMINTSDKLILVANPFIESCYLTEALLQVREKGTIVKIVTRPPTRASNFANKKECLSELSDHGVLIKYNRQIHSKIVVFDGKIAIVSSMNFTSMSSSGASLEAGMVSIDQKVVSAASKYVERLFERPDPSGQTPNHTSQVKQSQPSTTMTTAQHNLVKPKPTRAGKRWTSEEDEALKKEYTEGLTISQLATKHQRKYGAIRARLAHLGLIEDFFFRKRGTNP